MKRLPPAIQEEQRYLEFQLHSDEKHELGDVVDAVWDAVLEFLGSKEASRADIWIMGDEFQESEQRGVIQVNRDAVNEVRAALALLDEIDGVKAFIRVTQVSGTLDPLD